MKKKPGGRSARVGQPEEVTHFFAKQLQGEDPPSARIMGNCVFAAMTFGSRSPWSVLDDQKVFAYDPPGSSIRYYCCVLGMLGEVHRLVIYEGDEGYAFHRRMSTTDLAGVVDFYTSANMTYVDFQPPSELSVPDKQLLRACGLKPVAGALWPAFRRIRKGALEWYVTAEEAAVIPDCLLAGVVAVGETTLHPLKDFWSDPGKLPLIRIEHEPGSRTKVSVKMIPVPRIRKKAQSLKVPHVDRARIEEIRMVAVQSGQAWELDCGTAPLPIGKPNERPWLPKIAFAADSDSRYVFPPVLDERTKEPGELMASALLGAIESAGMIPARLHVASAEVKTCLTPLTDALGIVAEVRVELPAFSECLRVMAERKPF